jgi:uncharacterized phiE125 gp8 family phage protein
VYELITAPTSEPVSTSELKSQLRITGTDQDTMLDLLISVARQHVEDYLRVQIMTATWELYLDEFPATGECIYIQKSPVTAISSIKYLDSSGVEQTWSATEYSCDYNSTPCRIYEAYGYSWPTVRDIRNCIYIRFVAGYAADYKIFQEKFKLMKQAILMVAASLYENPTDEVTGTQVQQILKSSNALLRPLRSIRY